MKRNGAATLSTTAQVTASAVTSTLQRRTVSRHRIGMPPRRDEGAAVSMGRPRVVLSSRQAAASTTKDTASTRSAEVTPNAAVNSPPAAGPTIQPIPDPAVSYTHLRAHETVLD